MKIENKEGLQEFINGLHQDDKLMMIQMHKNEETANMVLQIFTANCDRHDLIAMPSVLLSGHFNVSLDYFAKEIENSVKKWHLKLKHEGENNGDSTNNDNNSRAAE